MKRVTYLLNVLIVLILSSCLQSKDAESKKLSGQWTKYSDLEYEIQYPNEWNINISGQDDMDFILLSPLESENDKFRENVNLVIQDLRGQNYNLNSYVELSEDQVNNFVSNGEVLTSERKNNDKGEFHYLVYKADYKVYNLIHKQYFWLINDFAYVLTFTGEKEKFDMYNGLSEKIMNSFKMK